MTAKHRRHCRGSGVSTGRSRVMLDSPLRDASWVNITPGRSPEGEFLVSHRETMKLDPKGLVLG